MKRIKRVGKKSVKFALRYYKTNVKFISFLYESPADKLCRALFLSVFALHRDRTEELYFITLVLIRPLVRPHGVIGWEWFTNRPYRAVKFKFIDYNSFYYFTIAFTAASPSTATTTIPAGTAIVALSEERTVLAIV